MYSFTYTLCKSKIDNNLYKTQEEMQTMLDVFFAGNRITLDEYAKLTDQLTAKHTVTEVEEPTDPTVVTE